MAERFQPKTVASFNRHQLESFMDWANDNGVTHVTGEDGKGLVSAFKGAVEDSQFDEKGKPMNEKGRERLRIALSTLAALLTHKVDLATIEGDILVWNTPDPGKLRFEYKVNRRRVL